MKKLFEIANLYLKESSWKDLTLVKFCLFAMGVLVGAQIPKRNRDEVSAAAAGVFAVTYVPLMLKLYKVAREHLAEKANNQ